MDPHAEHALDTRLIHAGEPSPRIGGAAVPPVFMSTVFEYRGEPGGPELAYPRYSNLPNHEVLRKKLAAIEEGEDAVVAATGMAAITAAMIGVAADGGHLLVQRGIYGGAHVFVSRDLATIGIEHTFVDADDPGSWERALRPTTRAIYTEAMTNPCLEVADHRAVVAFARRHGIASMIDATFASPVNFQPLRLGYDLCLHSGTKYLNGHSDLACGAAVGKAALVEKARRIITLWGGSLDPHACFLLHRGLRTMALRVRRQNESAQRIAGFLAEHGAVRRVAYPGLPDHPHHARARELFSGCGGVLSFELEGGAAAAERLFDRVRIPIIGPSLGGVDTLMTRPAMTSHRAMPPDERRAAGIADGLVRLSVGIEDVDDLVHDLEQALAV